MLAAVITWSSLGVISAVRNVPAAYSSQQINWPDGCGDLPRCGRLPDSLNRRRRRDPQSPAASGAFGGRGRGPSLASTSPPRPLFDLLNFLAGNIVAGIEALTARPGVSGGVAPPAGILMRLRPGLERTRCSSLSVENAFRGPPLVGGVESPPPSPRSWCTARRCSPRRRR